MSFSKNEVFGHFLFLLNPFLTFFLVITRYSTKWSKNLLWLSCSYYGYAVHVTPEYTGDAIRYVNKFKMHAVDGLTYESLFQGLIEFNSVNYLEIVERFISYSVSLITSDYKILFVVYAILFGYFLSRNIDYVIKNLNIHGWYKVFVVSFLFLLNPIWNINGFNFWFATQVFIYGYLPIVLENKYKFSIFVLLTPFIHYAYLLFIPIIALFYLIKYINIKNYFYVYLLSFLIISIDLTIFDSIFRRLAPELIYLQVYNYLNPELTQGSGGRFLNIFNEVSLYSLNLLFITVYLEYKKRITTDYRLEELIKLSFYLTACFNVLSVIPSVGRFLVVCQWLLVISVFYYFGMVRYKTKIKKYFFYALPFLLIGFTNEILLFFNLTDLTVIVTNIFVKYYYADVNYVVGNLFEIIF